MIKAVRIKILPNNKQQTKLFQFAGASRFAYNWALDKQMDNFREGRKLQSDYDLRKEFTVLRRGRKGMSNIHPRSWHILPALTGKRPSMT